MTLQMDLFLLLMATALLHYPVGEASVFKLCPKEDTHKKYGCTTTLEDYVESTVLKGAVDDYTTLEFLSGTHELSKDFHITQSMNVTSFTMKKVDRDLKAAVVKCTRAVSMGFSSIDNLSISDLKITSCGKGNTGVEIENIRYEVVLKNIDYMNNSAIYMYNSTVTLYGNNSFVDNHGFYGGTLSITQGTLVVANGTTDFRNSWATNAGGAIYLNYGSLKIIGNTTFTNNTGGGYGGAIYASIQSLVTIDGTTTFRNNLAFGTYGGGIYTEGHIEISGISTFTGNNAHLGKGGAIFIKNANAEINGTVAFAMNSADYGAAVSAENSRSVQFSGTTIFTGNTALISGGSMYVKQSKICFDGLTEFTGNTAGIDVPGDGGAINADRNTVIIMRGRSTFKQNSARYGGAVYATITSALQFYDSVCFMKNSAYNGGALFLTETSQASVLADVPETVFDNNSAESNGGAIFLYKSHLEVHSENFTLANNSAKLQGGAVYVLFSNITFNATTFSNNSASEGGGSFLAGESYLIVLKKVNFISNHAHDKGGAILVDDQQVCSWQQLGIESYFCFFMVSKDIAKPYQALYFENNTAEVAGNILYGGDIDNCFLWQCQDFNTTSDTDCSFNFSLSSDFNDVSNNIDNGRSNITSNAVRICLCYDGKPNCSYSRVEESIFPGQNLTISAVTVGQRNETAPSFVTLVANPSSEKIPQPQKVQTTNYTCTDLKYTVYSNKTTETLRLKTNTDSKCSDQGAPKLIIDVILKCCPLSHGFQFSENLSSCVCANRLNTYTDLCNITTQTIYRAKNFWAGYYGNTICTRQLNSSAGLILHPHCPFDYCTLVWDYLNLSDPDQQCNYNRTGLLCGKCKNGLSLGLGTSRCLECSNYFLLLLVAFAVAGIILVFLLFACHLTVAQGTISGLIFYVNIVHSNRTIFFPRGEVNGLSVFIAWLNLDLGIETCFYHGMDVYARTWLQFVFPLYIWMLCGVIIFASSKSQRISKILGSNPVAVLTTLFLLSFSKILRTLISALSFTRLEYPYGAKFVWLYDGNITYLQGKHIPLFIVALVALFLCLPYTILLLLGQWLRALSNNFLFRWMNSLRLKYILDTYNAPYKSRHCYWTGLLLVSRLVLLLIFATNIFGDSSINLLVISVASTSLFLWSSAVYGGPYTNNVLNVIEAFSIANLSILSTGSLYIQQSKGNQTALTYTSSGLSLTVFMGLLIYNSTVRIKLFFSWISKNVRERRRSMHEFEELLPVIEIPPINIAVSASEVSIPDARKRIDGYCIHTPLEPQLRNRAIVHEPEWNVNDPVDEPDVNNPKDETNVENPRDGNMETSDEQSPLPVDVSHYSQLELEDNKLREPLLEHY